MRFFRRGSAFLCFACGNVIFFYRQVFNNAETKSCRDSASSGLGRLGDFVKVSALTSPGLLVKVVALSPLVVRSPAILLRPTIRTEQLFSELFWVSSASAVLFSEVLEEQPP